MPDEIPRPAYVGTGLAPPRAPAQIMAGDDLERLRRACRVASEVLAEAAAAVAPGVTTDEIDAVAHAAYLSRGAYPSTLGYRGFPKGICTSVNEVVCHGIPDDRPLAEGDIVNVDVTAYLDGVHGDTSATVLVGDVDLATRALVETTRESVERAVTAVRPGATLDVVARAIQPLAFDRGFGVVRDIGGHGIGRAFHAEPHVHHTLERVPPVVLEPGMAFTIEPMVTAGRETHRELEDGWTVVTEDGLCCAQFEHTVVVTDDGVEVLTRWP